MPLILYGSGNIVGTGSVTIGSGSGSALRIDTGNRVFRSQNPGFLAYRTSTYTTQGSAIPFNATLFNRGNHFDIATGFFTCPVDGDYLITAYTIGSSSTDIDAFGVYKNNVAIDPLWGPYGSTSGHQTQGLSFILPLVTNDTISVRVQGGAWYGDARGGHNAFQVMLMG